MAVFGPCESDDSMPSKSVVRQAQQKELGADDANVQYFESDIGNVIPDNEGLFRAHVRGRYVLSIQSSDKPLQIRLIICAHVRDAGHRGVAATLVHL